MRAAFPPRLAPGILVRAALLVVAGAGLGVVQNAVRRDGVRVASYAPPSACTVDADARGPEVLDAAACAELCAREGALLVDARPARAFAEGHAAGAVHLPCDAAGHAAAEVLARFDGAPAVVVYGATTDAARPVAEGLLQRNTGARVALLDGGFEAWSRAGLACASGPCDDVSGGP